MVIEKIARPFENIIRYDSFILVGVLMTIGTLAKLLGIIKISSDWFWLLAGVGLTIEGIISLVKQRRFDRKYKIIDRNGEELNKNKL
ncbi:MAG TPA: hypothetical protein VJG31_03955 [Candidatus Nanoarchaeia archaeon]|nr:hypothetical protein [Candidatus Nanoarchaeia archaeon]